MKNIPKISSANKRLVPFGTGLIVLVCLSLIISGCSLKQLKNFKEKYDKERYQWIIEEKVTCKPGSSGCNQVHLIKGNSCFILVDKTHERNGKMSLYSCAVEEFAEGIKQTHKWQLKEFNLDRAQTYENYCQALRNLQDMQSDEKAKALGSRFLDAAKEFHKLEPDHYGANYFFALAQFRKAFSEFIANPSQKRQICNQYRQILRHVEAMIARGEKDLDQSWTVRYRENYGDLKGKLKLEIEACPEP